MTDNTSAPNALGLDHADSADGWTGSSTLLLMVSLVYWMVGWLSAGLPPLALLLAALRRANPRVQFNRRHVPEQ